HPSLLLLVFQALPISQNLSRRTSFILITFKVPPFLHLGKSVESSTPTSRFMEHRTFTSLMPPLSLSNLLPIPKRPFTRSLSVQPSCLSS
ncbi:hypothetical protein H0H93_010760, partial [Arthromyces matolae]